MTSCPYAPTPDPTTTRPAPGRRGRGVIAWTLALSFALAACSSRGPTLAEVAPIDRGSARPEPLPTSAELAAARVTALSLAFSDSERVLGALEALRAVEQEDASSSLLNDATDLYQATRGRRAYRDYAEGTLANGATDIELERRLQRFMSLEPLSIARQRMREDRTLRFGQVFNRIASPAVNAALGNPVGAIETGRAAILALIVLSTAPELTIQQRQALREYKRFLERDQESPDSLWVSGEVSRLEARLQLARAEDARGLAERALDARRPDAALLHLARARRIDPDGAATQRLTLVASEELREDEQRLTRSLRAAPPEARGFRATAGVPGDSLVANVLASPLSALPELSVEWSEDAADMGLEDEIEFLAAAGRMATGDEDGYFEAMRSLAFRDARDTNMGRHAFPIATTEDLYAAYTRAQSATLGRTTKFLFLGSFASRPPRDIPLLLQPLAALVEAPSFVIAVATTPLRIIEVPSVRARLSGPVLNTGEEYLQRFPQGTHAASVHRDLEGRYAARGQWSQALTHHEARAEPDPDVVARYRDEIADRTLEAARLPRRADIRVALYRNLIEDYPGTDAARAATQELEDMKRTLTPQAIRLSRKFLLENPEVTEPGALGLRPELLDGDDDNGEISKEGVLLIGKTFVRIQFEDRDPVDVDLRTEAFARFSGLLEQAYERGLQRDPRAKPIPDPQRDQFFERARLGLLDQADFRLAAASSFEFLGMNERYGPGRGRDSILPVELVVRGGLEDFGVAAVPRVRMPKESEDAFLYK